MICFEETGRVLHKQRSSLLLAYNKAWFNYTMTLILKRLMFHTAKRVQH